MRRQKLFSLATNCLLNTSIGIEYEGEQLQILSISPSRRKYLLRRHFESLVLLTVEDGVPWTNISLDMNGTLSSQAVSYGIYEDTSILDISWLNNETIIILLVKIISDHVHGFYVLGTGEKDVEFFEYSAMTKTLPSLPSFETEYLFQEEENWDDAW